MAPLPEPGFNPGDIVNTITAAATDAATTVTQAATNVATTATQEATNIATTVTSAGENVATTAADGIGTGISAAGGAIGGATGVIGGLSSDLKDWGINQMIQLCKEWANAHAWIYAVIAILIALLLYSCLSIVLDCIHGFCCCFKCCWCFTLCCYRTSRCCLVDTEHVYERFRDHPRNPKNVNADPEKAAREGHYDPTYFARRCGRIPLNPEEGGMDAWKWYGKKGGKLDRWVQARKAQGVGLRGSRTGNNGDRRRTGETRQSRTKDDGDEESGDEKTEK